MSKFNWQSCTLLMNLEEPDEYINMRVLIRAKVDKGSTESVMIGSYNPELKNIEIGYDNFIEEEELNLYEFIMLKEIC